MRDAGDLRSAAAVDNGNIIAFRNKVFRRIFADKGSTACDKYFHSRSSFAYDTISIARINIIVQANLNCLLNTLSRGGYLYSFLSFLSNYIFLFILHVTHSESFPKPLSKTRERELIELSSKGDINARNILVEHNLRLVAHIIKKYYQTGANQDDLVSIGTIGLIKAVNTFNPDKNIKLSSYASRCIENEILMYFRNNKKSAQDVSLNDTIDTDKDGNPLTLMDIMASDDNIAEDIDTKIHIEKLSKFIDETLTKREKQVIIYRYGLYGTDILTQRELAKKLGISRSYISRIEKKALQKLRSRYEKG